jgi:hypothetical protein
MDRVRLLIHTCLHRATQYNAPYVVDGATYFDPGRLIWLWDIHLLANALTGNEWPQLCAMTASMSVSAPCREALVAAQATFGTALPGDTMRTLGEAAGADPYHSYFTRSHAASRAFQDVGAIAGLSTKLRYIRSRIVTTEAFLRSKYPQLAARPLPVLYGRRLLDLVLRRSNAS